MHQIQLNVNLSYQQLADAIRKLSPQEKLQISDVLWGSDMDIPMEHQNLVLKRINKARNNPETMLDWDEASKTLKP